RLTGSSVRRVEDPRILTGRGRYVDDIELPGMLHAAFVRSPWPHATLTRVDVSAALAVDGVVAAFTAADVEGIVMQGGAPDGLLNAAYLPLASDRVRFVGDPVAIVLATSRAAAEDGCDAVELDADPHEPIATIDHALDPSRPAIFQEAGTNVLLDKEVAYGDVDAAFARADRVVTATFTQQRQTHLPMEGRALICDFQPARQELTVHAAHQNPQTLRMALAGLLGLPAHAVHVLCDDIGGSFGQKAYVSREEVAVAAASKAVGRPVKWIEDRVENLLAAGQARDERIEVTAAVSSEGDLLGLRAHMTLDQGAYQLTTLPPSIFPTIVRVLLPGAYRLRDYSFRTTVVASNKATYMAFRGPWAAETFVRERLLDLIAGELGLDRVEVRRRNLRTPDELAEGTPGGLSLHAVTARETLERAVERWGPIGPGTGIAQVLEPAPGPPEYAVALGAGASPRTAQRATCRMEPDGTLTVMTSQSPHGQSHQTTLAQLAADTLSVPIERVRIVHGDTRLTPFNGVGTGGSRAATLASGAVIGVVEVLGERIKDVAADLLEANRDDLELADGRIQVKGTPTAGVDLATLARAAYSSGQSLEAAYDFAVPEGGWSQATHLCQVEVDGDTGLVRILRYLVVGDCGALINPAVVEGQVRGGIAQGIGGVLHEWAAYDADGQPQATTLLDYLAPGALDLPTIDVEHLESPPQGPLDFRGVGEGGAIGAPAALVSAIADAIGVPITERYLPPARILELMGTI
ncbi:MAG: Carbon-monoxide dehydrogenase (acceptor), partial [Actinomycetia bacterium]|nr:Carbon-monoxide dehydrogenase (acceptor) [Actinomycetes bacterium]